MCWKASSLTTKSNNRRLIYIRYVQCFTAKQEEVEGNKPKGTPTKQNSLGSWTQELTWARVPTSKIISFRETEQQLVPCWYGPEYKLNELCWSEFRKPFFRAFQNQQQKHSVGLWLWLPWSRTWQQDILISRPWTCSWSHLMSFQLSCVSCHSMKRPDKD